MILATTLFGTHTITHFELAVTIIAWEAVFLFPIAVIAYFVKKGD